MKSYIFNRMKRAEARILDRIYWYRHKEAKDINFKEDYEYIMQPMTEVKIPAKYREQVSSIFIFIFTKIVSKEFIYPVLYEGKLYSKWDSYPKGLKYLVRNGADTTKMRPYPVFSRDFTEGMEAEL